MRYDIVGDIHGQADMLEELLCKLGYDMKDGIYQHKADKAMAVFVGDFIDRGIQNRRVIEIVRNMVDGEHAYAVMGNHEYNAICYHTRKPNSKADWLRSHTQSKFKQHENFLKEYPLGHSDTHDLIEWFRELPLFIDDDRLPFRIIHGCWDQKFIDYAKSNYLSDNNQLVLDYFAESAGKPDDTPGTDAGEVLTPFVIIERLLKGVEVKLPEKPQKITFADKDGNLRCHIRVKWWGKGEESYRNLSVGYSEKIMNSFPGDQFPDSADIPIYGLKEKPVFFGHYWMAGTPDVQRDNVCCVDYSAGKGEKLVCYCFTTSDERNGLQKSNFRWAGNLR